MASRVKNVWGVLKAISGVNLLPTESQFSLSATAVAGGDCSHHGWSRLVRRWLPEPQFKIVESIMSYFASSVAFVHIFKLLAWVGCLGFSFYKKKNKIIYCQKKEKSIMIIIMLNSRHCDSAGKPRPWDRRNSPCDTSLKVERPLVLIWKGKQHIGARIWKQEGKLKQSFIQDLMTSMASRYSDWRRWSGFRHNELMWKYNISIRVLAL